MRHFFSWLKWKLSGCPMIQYDGYNCGLCGQWVKENFDIPAYKSGGRWWDTWGLCGGCIHGRNKYDCPVV